MSPKYAYDVEFQFFIPMAESWSESKRKKLFATPCISKPDVDNYVKFYMDCLNGLVVPDDAQVFRISAEKLWSDNPRTAIIVRIV